ncbi:hypothetical protein [Aureibaculum luteum]|uniref:hypothetical protein n=1 Tax=Aureibaculum luteum TaxID=1548456 RepID=UPI000E538AD5|nr:hypothetical protein [Aureibaculum luteum]
MKKIVLLIIVSVGIISCTKNQKPSGIWISVKDKPMTSKNGYLRDFKSLILDFEKLEFSNLSTSQDSIIKFEVDPNNNNLSQPGDTANVGYTIYNKDSLELNFDFLNLTLVLVPLNLEFELNSSKTAITEYLFNNEFKLVRDTMKLNFSNEYFSNEYFTKGIKNKRILKSKFLKNKEFVGYWYIGQKNKNYFLVCNFDPYGTHESIYQITEFQKTKITLKGILTEGFGKKITELETNI